MPPFYRSAWFPYVVPFLVYLTLVQVEMYLPQWHDHTFSARVLLCAGLLWMWRKHYHQDMQAAMVLHQYIYAIAFGVAAFACWPLAIKFGIITLQNPADGHYPGVIHIALTTLKLVGFIVVFPVMNELFWRSFMLRYFINPDFRSISLGTAQLFSVLGVTILSGLAFQYGPPLSAVSLLLSLLLIWQKNLRCCIVAHGACQLLLAGYLYFSGGVLF
jgi:CAAX prenyl protease-like protein